MTDLQHIFAEMVGTPGEGEVNLLPLPLNSTSAREMAPNGIVRCLHKGGVKRKGCKFCGVLAWWLLLVLYVNIGYASGRVETAEKASKSNLGILGDGQRMVLD